MYSTTRVLILSAVLVISAGLYSMGWEQEPIQVPPELAQPETLAPRPPHVDASSEKAKDEIGPARSWLWPRISPPVIEDSHATTAIQGHDPMAPRPLELWRIDAQGAHSMGRTESNARGRFDFGRVVLPHSELRLAVTPPGVDPLSVSPMRLSRTVLPSPRVGLEYADATLWARIIPARLEGEIQILGEDDEILFRLPVRGEPIEVEFDEVDLGQTLRITHSLPSGKRSQPYLFHQPEALEPEHRSLNFPGDQI